ncbi:MAG: tRNA (5-methylaminomethyl-2-thiouridine)(34)-methyltransferase MnmD [Pseudomonadota bacterium]
MHLPQPDLEWRDDKIPVSLQFDDPYFSLDNGLHETRHVFLAGNGLPDRFSDGFHIAELGFGTGLNLLTTLLEWRRTKQNGTLRFTSFEAYPMSPADMVLAQSAFPEITAIAAEFAPLWPELWQTGRLETPELFLSVVVGDARQTLPNSDLEADCWFLDGFSPAKNPELWDADLMQAVADHTNPLGTFATYTAAGFVRRNLEAAGFSVERVAGYGRKRHMTIGTKKDA